MRDFNIIEIPSELGAGMIGAGLGADAFRAACIRKGYDVFDNIPISRVEYDRNELYKPIKYQSAKRIEYLADYYELVAKKIKKIITGRHFPIVLTGDHSNAIGVLAGVKMAFPKKRLGIIWMDAHGDLHTPYSTPSGNLHGMPVAATLGLDNKKLANRKPEPGAIELWERVMNIGGIFPKVLPEDIVFIGLRDLEEEEWEIVRKNKLKFFRVEEVAKKNTNTIAEEVLDHLSDCELIYLSFDVDCLDERVAPGTGTASPNGFKYSQARNLLRVFWASPKLVGFEVTEINPLEDIKNQTAMLAADLVEDFVTFTRP